MLIVASWDKLSEVPCLIEFSSKGKKAHEKAIESTEIVWNVLASFRWGALLPIDGMIGPEDYDQAIGNSHFLKNVFVSLARDKEEKEFFERSGRPKSLGFGRFRISRLSLVAQADK